MLVRRRQGTGQQNLWKEIVLSYALGRLEVGALDRMPLNRVRDDRVHVRQQDPVAVVVDGALSGVPAEQMRVVRQPIGEGGDSPCRVIVDGQLRLGAAAGEDFT